MIVPMSKPAECAFCRIVAGETAAAIVMEDDDSLAFLDARPLFPGHCLLIPKRHYETLPDLPPELLRPLFGNAQILAAAMVAALGAEGSFVAVNNKVSQSVPHLHVHIVPRRRKDGLRGFFWPRTSYSSVEEMNSVRDKLRAAIVKNQPE